MRIAAGSEPASGSDSANAGASSPLANRGSHRSLSSGEPNSEIGSDPSSWSMRISALLAHTLAISSTAICSISVPVPVPPYSVEERQRQHVLLGEQPPDVPRVLGGAVDLGGARRDLLLREPAHQVAKVEQVLRYVVEIGVRRIRRSWCESKSVRRLDQGAWTSYYWISN